MHCHSNLVIWCLSFSIFSRQHYFGILLSTLIGNSPKFLLLSTLWKRNVCVLGGGPLSIICSRYLWSSSCFPTEISQWKTLAGTHRMGGGQITAFLFLSLMLWSVLIGWASTRVAQISGFWENLSSSAPSSPRVAMASHPHCPLGTVVPPVGPLNSAGLSINTFVIEISSANPSTNR